MDRVDITVKNTFVHLCDPCSPTGGVEQRSSSAPGLLRFSAGSAAQEPGAGEDVKLVPPASPAPAVGGRSDVSTSWDSASEHESVSSSHRPQRGEGHGAAPAPRPWSPSPAARPLQGRRHRSRAPRGSGAVEERAASGGAGCAGGSWNAVASAAAMDAKPQPLSAVGQLALVVGAAAAALEGLSFVVSAKTRQGPRGASIVAQVRAEDAGSREAALEAAMEALLRAAKASTCVRVLGSKAQPFVSTPVGFAAHLGAVSNEGAACWSMLDQGFCRRGCACRWEHPVGQTMVNVMVQVERHR